VNLITTTAPGWAAALNPQSTEDAWKIAQALSKSGFVPKAFQNQPNEILIAAAMGARLGLDVFSALQSVAVVNGKPTLYGDALLAVCQSRSDWRGQSVKWEGAGDDERVTVTIRRQMAGGAVDSYEGRFSVREAKQANLWSKQGPWAQFPRRMMEMRARAYALRGAFADALLGFHAREEMEDVTTAADVTASATVRTESRLFSDDAPPDKSPAKQQLDDSTREVERRESESVTVESLKAAAKDKDAEEVDRVLQSFCVGSYADLTPDQLPACLKSLTELKTVQP
jgi:hypothetical protein